jgi:hypothetical protein
MANEDYRNALIDALGRLGELGTLRAEIEVELAKLQQFITATLNMLPEDQQAEFSDAIGKRLKSLEGKTASLTDAIRKVLQNAKGDRLTVANVRDRLIASGFDFTDYTSNPLASVSTTLKRMKPDEVESSLIAGVTVYRWNGETERPTRLPEVPKVGSSKSSAFPDISALVGKRGEK